MWGPWRLESHEVRVAEHENAEARQHSTILMVRPYMRIAIVSRPDYSSTASHGVTYLSHYISSLFPLDL